MQDQLPYYDSAQYFLDKAISRKGYDDKMKSEIMVVQSLIYGLRTGPYWASNDRTNAEKYSQLESEALNEALRLNKDNPRIYLLGGASIIYDGRRMKNEVYYLAGTEMLKTAEDKYKKFPAASPIHPNWGRGWISFWLSQAKN
jgi:hypothetical protein